MTVDEHETDLSKPAISSASQLGSPKTVTHYLVKWRGLSYEDSTWELAEDIDQNKIKQFHERRTKGYNEQVYLQLFYIINKAVYSFSVGGQCFMLLLGKVAWVLRR